MAFWNNKKVVLVGGASFIGSHLSQELINRNVLDLKVFDNLYSGEQENVPSGVEFIYGDAREMDDVYPALRGADIVFHLACQHGGRGYVAGHRIQLFDNLTVDAKVFRACSMRNVEKVIFSSSACAYPVDLQTNPDEILRLDENKLDWTKAILPDGPYGWAKLMGEMSLDAYTQAKNFKGIATRSFTVYGPRMKEHHAIAALIAKTFIKDNEFEIWGDGNQIRNWTYVTDNVRGALLAAEKLESGPINIGVEDRLTPNIACEIIWDILGWKPNNIIYNTNAPVGPVNRVADSDKLRSLGWKPEYTFRDGLETTIDWYIRNHNVDDIKNNLKRKLTEVS